MVLLSGCHIGDCHYIDANTHAEKRFNKTRRIMRQAELDPSRLELVWVSAAEGQRFQEKINSMSKKLKTIPSEEIKNAMKYFGDRERKRLEKLRRGASEVNA